jgi:hypothetical protein
VNFVAGLLRNGVGRRWGSQWLRYANVERKKGEKWGSGTLWPHGGEGKGGGGCGQWRATRGVTEGVFRDSMLERRGQVGVSGGRRTNKGNRGCAGGGCPVGRAGDWGPAAVGPTQRKKFKI